MDYKIEKIQYEKDWGTTDIGKIVTLYEVVVYNDNPFDTGDVYDNFKTREEAEELVKELNKKERE